MCKTCGSSLDIEPTFPEPCKRTSKIKKKRLFEFEALDEVIEDAKNNFEAHFFSFSNFRHCNKINRGKICIKKYHNDDFKFNSSVN